MSGIRSLGLQERFRRTERQQQIQSVLPLNLVPIRIDIDIPSFRPEAPFPLPVNPREYGIDESHAAYRHPDATPAYRLKDTFLWNLHEAMTTPDQFARVFVDEIDIPPDKKTHLIQDITKQIREQLEQHAQVALHPLFETPNPSDHGESEPPKVNGGVDAKRPQLQSSVPDHTVSLVNGISPSPAPTPLVNGTASSRLHSQPDAVAATATRPNPNEPPLPKVSPVHDPDDTYRCVLTLNVNLLNRLYSDRFEWSLIHPPGLAEHFARQTAADLGLPGEWAAAIAHTIYEAVLRLRKEVIENGGQLLLYGEIDNDAAPTAATSLSNGSADMAQQAEAGWRYDPENLATFWAPKVEALSKEEIEKREGDRERQLRRARRERERYSTAVTLTRGDADMFQQEEPSTLGRGERTKKKKRYRSLSPLGRDSPDTGGAGVATGPAGTVQLSEVERNQWRCRHCNVWGPAVWGVKEGPAGPKTLCHNCGLLYERDGRLPLWSKGLFKDERIAWTGVSMPGRVGMGVGTSSFMSSLRR